MRLTAQDVSLLVAVLLNSIPTVLYPQGFLPTSLLYDWDSDSSGVSSIRR